MSELRRLLDSDATEAERALLRSGLEEPDSKMVQRAAAALGVAASVVTVAQVSAAGTQAAAIAGTQTAAVAGGKAAVPALLAVGKWLAVVGVVGAAGVGTYQVLREPEAAPAKPPATAAAPRAAVAPPVAAPVEPAPLVEAAPDVAPRSAAPEARSAARVEPKAGYSSVADEVKAIGQIRGAVSRGDGKQALTLLDAYDRRFSEGALRQEATLLRVQALQLSGDRKGAQALGERFIEANPQSPHQQRVRGLLGGGGTAAKPEAR